MLRRAMLVASCIFALGGCERSLADRLNSETQLPPASGATEAARRAEPASAPPPTTAAPPPEPTPPDVNDPVAGLSSVERAKLPFDPTGWYWRDDPEGKMRVRSRGGEWEIYIKAHALPVGEWKAPPCEMVVVGPLVGRRIAGRAVPFRSGSFEMDRGTTERTPGPLRVDFRDGRAVVTDRMNWPVCPLQSDLGGDYRRDDRVADLPVSIEEEAELAIRTLRRSPRPRLQGEYRRLDGAYRMTIRWTGDAWRVMLLGKNRPYCETVVEGPLRGDAILGRVVGYELKRGPWLPRKGAVELRAQGYGDVTVSMSNGRAEVSAKDDMLCGDVSEVAFTRVRPR